MSFVRQQGAAGGPETTGAPLRVRETYPWDNEAVQGVLGS
jgi:hypothetical protein